MGGKIETKEKADILDDLIQTQTGIFVDSLAFSKYTFNSDTSGYLFTDGSINTMKMWTTTRPSTKTQDLLLYQIAKSSGLLLYLIESNEIKEGYNKLTGTVCEVHINDISNSDHEVYLDEYTLYPFFINDKGTIPVYIYVLWLVKIMDIQKII